METIRKIIRGLSLIVFVVCGSILIKLTLIDPYLLNQTNNQIKKTFHGENDYDKRFDSLLAINPDIKGWIFVSNTRVDYPVLQSEGDPDFYLTHNYKKEASRYGSIFIDNSCIGGVDSKNTILHGHHMRDGEMFADIMKFSNIEFYKSNPIIEFDTVKESGDWKIISVFKTNTLPEQGKIFNYVISKFENADKFTKYVNEVRKRSLINIPVDVNSDDKLITLSTCSYEFKDFRTVIVARKVREGESRVVDTEAAVAAPNPLMPACWYERHGGVPPA